MGKALLILALGLHLGLAGGYLWRTPVFEGPDENAHAEYARHLLEKRTLPTILHSGVDTGLPQWHEAVMGHHPPLYYLLLAGTQLLCRAADVQPVALMPSAREGPAESHPVRWRHGWDEVRTSREVAVFRGLRLWSVLLGAASIGLTWALGRVVFPSRPEIAGGGAVLLACLPQWSFTHAVLDNGNLATTLALAALLVLVRGVDRGALGLRSGACAGLLGGLAFLAKPTVVSLVPVGLAAFFWGWLRWRAARRTTVLAACAFLAVGSFLAAPYLARNRMLYGELLATTAHHRAFAISLIPESHFEHWITVGFPYQSYRSLMGAFGWGTLLSPAWLGTVGKLVGLAALAGWALRGRRLVERGPALTALVLAALSALAFFVSYNLVMFQPQARYLFPGIGPWALLVAAGLVGLGELALPRRARPFVGGAAALSLAVLAVWVLERWVAPVFRITRPDPDPHFASLVAGMTTVRSEGEATLRLLFPADGAELDGPATFRWEPPPGAPPDARYTVHVLLADGRLIGGTYELAGIELAGAEWTCPPQFWEVVPLAEPALWKVRRLPDRMAGETVLETDESVARRFTRTR